MRALLILLICISALTGCYRKKHDAPYSQGIRLTVDRNGGMFASAELVRSKVLVGQEISETDMFSHTEDGSIFINYNNKKNSKIIEYSKFSNDKKAIERVYIELNRNKLKRIIYILWEGQPPEKAWVSNGHIGELVSKQDSDGVFWVSSKPTKKLTFKRNSDGLLCAKSVILDISSGAGTSLDEHILIDVCFLNPNIK